MAMSPVQSCMDPQMSHVKQSNRVAVPSAPPPPVPPKVVRKKPMPPPRSSMTKLTTVSTTSLTRQHPVDRSAVERSRESIATVGKSAPSEELCRPSDSLLTDFSKLSPSHVISVDNQLNREPYKKGVEATGRLQGTPSLADTAKSSVASNHSSLSKTKDASAIPSPAATGASFSKKTGLLNSSEVVEANHVALAARNSR